MASPKRTNFQKKVNGGSSFSIQKSMLQIFAILDDTSVMNFRKKLQHNLPKMRGGQRPFGTFPKIHPFWKGSASLREKASKSKFIQKESMESSVRV